MRTNTLNHAKTRLKKENSSQSGNEAPNAFIFVLVKKIAVVCATEKLFSVWKKNA